MKTSLLLAFVLGTASSVALAAERVRSVPDTPASFTLSGDQYWVVVSELADGEAAIGLARDQTGENPKVQVARTKDGKYAVLVGPGAKLSDEDLKSRFEGRGAAAANLRQSQGEEFVARAWEFKDERLDPKEMQEGKPFTVSAGSTSVTARVREAQRGKEDKEFFLLAQGRQDGNIIFTVRSEMLYSPEPAVRAAFVKLEGPDPQAVVSYYTGGAHCCMRSTVATKDAFGKWRLLTAATLDGDYGYTFEDLDGDGTAEMLSGDNRFLYQFDSYASSRMPAKIEKVIGGRIVDVTREPKYRRYHVQALAALEAGADDETWKQGGFLAGWVAQKVLVGEGAEAFARAAKLYNPNGGAPFEECTIKRPLETCPEKNKKQVPFAEALRKFLGKNGYR